MFKNQLESGYIWLAFYFLSSLTLTIYNKAVMQFVGFNYPWLLTGIHTFCSAVGCFVAVFGLKLFEPAKLGQHENNIMLAFSVLYTINIAVSNISLNLVTVPFHQVVRATTPIFTILLSILFLKKSYSTMIYISLIPVILGVALATYGDYNYTTMGFILTLLGTVLAAIKTVVTNVVQVGSLKLHPIDLLLRMSPLAFLQCIMYAYLSGELNGVQEYAQTKLNWGSFFALMFNGVLAFFLNIVSFTANKKTSALTMTVAADVKQVLTIVLSFVIFNLSVNTLNLTGITLTLAGGAWYTYLEMKEKKAKSTQSNPQYTPIALTAVSVEDASTSIR